MTGEIEGINRPLVVLFGAGASHGARDGSRPPLGQELIHHLLNIYNGIKADRKEAFKWFFEYYEKEAKGLIEKLKESASQKKNYETFLSEYRKQVGNNNFRDDEIVKVLTKLLAASMVSFWLWPQLEPALTEFPFFEQRDRYDDLIHSVKLGKLQFPMEKIVFVTPNYDVLFEQSLIRAGLFQEPKRVLSWPKTSESDALLLKIHGSANWVGNMGDHGFLDSNKPIPIGMTQTSNSDEYSNSFSNWNQGFDHLVDLGNEIIMAHYTIDKPGHVNLGLIEHIRNRAIQYVQRCEQAILLGIHLEERRDADPCLFEILTELRKCRKRGVPVTYVGIDGAEAEKAKSEYKFKILTEGFSGFLESLR